MVRTHFLWPRFSQLTPLVAACSLVILVLNVSRSAEPPETNASEVVVTAEAESESLTSPSEEQAAEQKKEVPGGFTLRNADEMKLGRASNFDDLLQRTPGLFFQTDNGTEMTKISIRGSGGLKKNSSRCAYSAMVRPRLCFTTMRLARVE